MPTNDRLADAAIAFQQVMERAGVPAGIFGGFAVASMGGPRASKDVDCIAKVDKDQIIELLNGQNGFVAVPQSRQDYVAFIWSDKADRSNGVLLEVFTETFPGSLYTLDASMTIPFLASGQLQRGPIPLLKPVLIFKGKLRACALRNKYTDAADLRWLQGRFEEEINQARSQIDLMHVGMAIKRSPELQIMFQRMGLDVQAATAAATNVDLDNLPRDQPGAVQRGLLGPPSRLPTPSTGATSGARMPHTGASSSTSPLPPAGTTSTPSSAPTFPSTIRGAPASNTSGRAQRTPPGSAGSIRR